MAAHRLAPVEGGPARRRRRGCRHRRTRHGALRRTRRWRHAVGRSHRRSAAPLGLHPPGLRCHDGVRRRPDVFPSDRRAYRGATLAARRPHAVHQPRGAWVAGALARPHLRRVLAAPPVGAGALGQRRIDTHDGGGHRIDDERLRRTEPGRGSRAVARRHAAVRPLRCRHLRARHHDPRDTLARTRRRALQPCTAHTMPRTASRSSSRNTVYACSIPAPATCAGRSTSPAAADPSPVTVTSRTRSWPNPLCGARI